MKKTIFIAFTTFLLGACNSNQKEENNMNTPDAGFDAFKNKLIEDLWVLYPGWATAVGFHDYDSILIVPDAAYRQKELDFSKTNLEALHGFQKDALSPNNLTDYTMLENALGGIAFGINELKSFEWDPSGWNVGGAFGEILNGTFAPLNARLRILHKKMGAVDLYYREARNQIKNPTLEHTALGIDQNLGSAGLFEKDIPDSVNACASLSETEKKEMLALSAACATSIKDFAAWLKDMKNESPRSFRLGKELFEKKFEFDIQSGYSPEAIYQKALARKEELHGKMAEITHQLWGKYFGKKPQPADRLAAISMMINRLSDKHVHRDSFQSAIEKQIPELEKFVSEKNILYLDPSKPLVVRKEPAYMAGVAGASISSPGPYDKNANTFYNVGSLSGWDDKRAESYLREYNYYILQILNIHEAVPGHYTQLVYSNQSPSLVKSIFGNGAMVEGWAVYTERMMLEEGYGNNEPEMWLSYYKWNLRATCNTILDYSVHVLDMPKEKALDLLIREAFQQEAEANGKWKRATLTQVQLCSYFTGYTEIYDLREEMKKSQGANFNLKNWHEKFLSFGSAPVREIRKLMLAQTGS